MTPPSNPPDGKFVCWALVFAVSQPCGCGTTPPSLSLSPSPMPMLTAPSPDKHPAPPPCHRPLYHAPLGVDTSASGECSTLHLMANLTILNATTSSLQLADLTSAQALLSADSPGTPEETAFRNQQLAQVSLAINAQAGVVETCAGKAAELEATREEAQGILVQQLRHHFGSFFAYFSQLNATSPPSCIVLLLRCPCVSVLIGACNPMFCPVYGAHLGERLRRRVRLGGRTAARGQGGAASGVP